MSAPRRPASRFRPDGSPALSGEVGRVVVTSLYNYAMPLIAMSSAISRKSAEACALRTRSALAPTHPRPLS